jgi:phenylalanyl-tRNA synthetase beta chain
VYNLNRKNEDLRLFEFGQVYAVRDKDAKEVTKKYDESTHLALFITGKKFNESWYSPEDNSDIVFLTSFVNNLLNSNGIDVDKLKFSPSEKAYLSEGSCYSTKRGIILEIGEINPSVLKQFDIEQPVYYAGCNWDMVLEELRHQKIQYKPVPKFPEVRRDLALLLDATIPYADVKKLAFQIERKLLKSVNLFDVYEGKNIEQGKKSYAVSFILRDEEKTLTDKVIDKTMKRLMTAYEKELNAIIR